MGEIRLGKGRLMDGSTGEFIGDLCSFSLDLTDDVSISGNVEKELIPRSTNIQLETYANNPYAYAEKYLADVMEKSVIEFGDKPFPEPKMILHGNYPSYLNRYYEKFLNGDVEKVVIGPAACGKTEFLWPEDLAHRLQSKGKLNIEDFVIMRNYEGEEETTKLEPVHAHMLNAKARGLRHKAFYPANNAAPADRANRKEHDDVKRKDKAREKAKAARKARVKASRKK